MTYTPSSREPDDYGPASGRLAAVPAPGAQSPAPRAGLDDEASLAGRMAVPGHAVPPPPVVPPLTSSGWDPPPLAPPPVGGQHRGVDAYRAEDPVALWGQQLAQPVEAQPAGDVARQAASYVYRPTYFLAPHQPPAAWGWRGTVRRATRGLLKPKPGEEELLHRAALAMVRSSFPAPRVITVANVKGGSGKTPTALILAEQLAKLRRESIVAWDANETRGTLGVRAGVQTPVHTVMDVLEFTEWLSRPGSAVGDLAGFLRRQESGALILASSEDAGEMRSLDAGQCATVRQLLMSRYSTIVIDTGNNEAAATFQFSTAAADVLVVPLPAKEDHLWAAGRMLEGLYQRQETRHLPHKAIAVVTDAGGAKLPPEAERWFKEHLWQLLYVPADPEIVEGPIRVDSLSQASQNAWTLVAAAVAEACTHPSDHDAVAPAHPAR